MADPDNLRLVLCDRCGSEVRAYSCAESKIMTKQYVHAMVLGRVMLCEVVKPKPCASFMTGLDDGPYLPGRAPRKASAPKTSDELRSIRAKAWETRRRVYGARGHR